MEEGPGSMGNWGLLSLRQLSGGVCRIGNREANMSKNGERIDPRVKRTRKLIEDAFNEMLWEKSFEEITVQEIAERAMVNRATFYAHYADKYVLLDQTMHASFQQKLTSNMSQEAGLTEENLRSLILTICGFLTEVHGKCKEMKRQFEPLVESQIKEIMREILLDWLKMEKLPRNGVPPELAATVASWSIYGAAQQWSREKRRRPAETFVRELLPLVLATLDHATHGAAA